ncbi:MAG: hydrolase [Conexibacter sp.]|nr:hydrolase [Conexibacter sp.]
MREESRFALGRFRTPTTPDVVAVVVGDVAWPLAGGVSLGDLLARWDDALPELQAAANRLASGDAGLSLGDLHPLPPVVPTAQIFQAGANYRTHVLDLMAAAERREDGSDGMRDEERGKARIALAERSRTGAPFVFQGNAHAVIGAEDDVVLPYDGVQPDWELELAVVIGRRARRVRREDALAYVAGYTIANDVTLRDRLRRADVPGGLDWLAAKNVPTFLPVGPLFVPAIHIEDPMDLQITLQVNGIVMQDESTEDMLFDVARLVEYLSTVSELRPGDLVLTGSPAGNGAHHGTFLSPGDLMEGEITGLGRQRNRCVAEPVAGAQDAGTQTQHRGAPALNDGSPS